ncbi:hypothetical protein HYH02_015462 [Chlamydomonas schloesseri]|uniref:CCHC-type domain-containing protein n=1 Tax=Chlamydomonas schloesseri TaxID=2026947 RepID=A0A835SF74_9CHLO|nr:hypothetical protein HYH02_015462 [Chlamydomonas schloesseri]|eukprot:KAG2422298.1 hypothetical protein HYH02_015462 [Chlamydomonas schloesseri]
MKGLGGVLLDPPKATAEEQQQALDILTLCVTDVELKRIVVNERTGTAAWKALRRHMLKLGETQKIALRTSFSNLKLGAKESLSSYFARGRQLQSDFNEIEDFKAVERGETTQRKPPSISDADVIRQLFSGLAGTQWGPVATPTLASIDINTATLEDLLNHMSWVGCTMKVQGAGGAGSSSVSGDDISGAIVPALAAGGAGGRSNPHAGKRCYKCGKMGHIKKDCRSKDKGQQQQAGAGQQQKPKQGHPSRFSPNHVVLAAAMYAGNGSSDGGSEPPVKDARLFLDSGSKRHLVHDKSLLFNFKPASGHTYICLGNGRRSVVAGSGTLVLQRTTNAQSEHLGRSIRDSQWEVSWNQSSTVVVHDVFYVPDASFNLLSVRSMGAKGLRTLFDNKVGFVLSRDHSADKYTSGGMLVTPGGHRVVLKAGLVKDTGLYAINSHSCEAAPQDCGDSDTVSECSYTSECFAAASAAAAAPAPETGAGAGGQAAGNTAAGSNSQGQAAGGTAAGRGHNPAAVLAHRRLGHINFQYLERMAADGMVTGLKHSAG